MVRKESFCCLQVHRRVKIHTFNRLAILIAWSNKVGKDLEDQENPSERARKKLRWKMRKHGFPYNRLRVFALGNASLGVT